MLAIRQRHRHVDNTEPKRTLSLGELGLSLVGTQGKGIRYGAQAAFANQLST